MRFALSNQRRIEATPSAKGTCPICDTLLIPKCGTSKVWHWAHKPKSNCKALWETETEWHRNWKLCFPEDWSEVVHTSIAGERHIADIRTPEGLIIEFQHSHICDRERYTRERFYGNMVWVVDGTRLKRDSNFHDGMKNNLRHGKNVDFYSFNGLGRQITRRWCYSEKLVYLDFGGEELWCVIPYRANWKFFAVPVHKCEFINACKNGKLPDRVLKLMLEDLSSTN